VAGALLSHQWKHGTGHVQRAKQVRRQLRIELLRGELLKEAGEEVACVVDQHVDAAELFGSGPNCLLGRRRARDVELDDEKVVGLSDRVGHGRGIAAGRDHRISCGEGGLSDVDAHTTSRTSDEPNSLASHLPQPSQRAIVEARNATATAVACAGVPEWPPSAGGTAGTGISRVSRVTQRAG
jgi:hypothetical protein